jgi:glycerophosphoryl diester phosphodiesterase/HEAT repeat protein
MKTLAASLLFFGTLATAFAAPATHEPQLLCHRTANQDVPENTLSSLQYAALAGCNVVEIDLRETLDHAIVLNHDGVLERLTDGEGEVEQTTLAELELLDAGSWMAPRFAGMRIARLEDALELSRQLNIKLMLDIKRKEIRDDVMRVVDREGMTDVVFQPYDGKMEWVGPDVTAQAIASLHAEDKTVVANFSANGHEMDLGGMRAAISAGADAIFVDYPSLGADAVGRPIEQKLRSLADQAEQGTDTQRAAAIASLAQYQDPDLAPLLLRWLDGPLPLSSHAAALALLISRPQIKASKISAVLQSQNSIARANAVWLLGRMHASAQQILPSLADGDSNVQRQALLALSRATGTAPQQTVRAFLESPNVLLRGAAALALAHLHTEGASAVILAALQKEIANEKDTAQAFVEGGRKHLSREQTQAVMHSFRAQMEMVRALGTLDGARATKSLEAIAFTPVHDFAQTDGLVAGFQLWDRAGDNPSPIVRELASTDPTIANRAEWALVKADARVLPAARSALSQPTSRSRAIRILAWHGDTAALPLLDEIAHSASPDRDLAAWAAEKIRLLNLPPD